jgi:N-acyl homoserine lactone hydrolase
VRPLETPLSGGRAGVTVRLRAMVVGQVALSPAMLERPGGRCGSVLGRLRATRRRGRVTVPVLSFLVAHPDAGFLLIDTGFPARAGRRVLGWPAMLVNGVRPGIPAIDQLAALGIAATEIRTIVLTHLHWDHASAAADFPVAQFLLDAREHADGRRAGGLFRGYGRLRPDPARVRTVDYAAAEPYGPFTRTIDLFGDGSVRLVSTAGHTPGHQSVLLRLDGREALITGDAAYNRGVIESGTLPLIAADDQDFRESLEEIAAYTAANPDALVVPGHDPEILGGPRAW